MKTISRIITPGMLVTGLLLTAFTFAQAQSTSAAWTTSKGVQKVANKQLFNDEDLKNSHIQATSVSPTWNISKGVNTIGSTDVAEVNIVSTNDASWIISKGVHQMNNETVVAKENTPSKELTSKGVQGDR